MQFVIGIDEVGRGSIAGPVSVGSFFVTTSNHSLLMKEAKKRKLPFFDSKKLTKIQREHWHTFLHNSKKKGLCDFVVEHTSSVVVDTIGITKAIEKGIKKSLTPFFLYASDTTVLLDGGLRAPSIFSSQKTIIKGDEKEFVIMCASIVAKVTRDRYMKKIATQYPEYGFEDHVGYGTKHHFEKVKLHGPSKIHRKTFLKSLLLE